MNMPVVPQDIEAYLDKDLVCDCGHTHRADIKRVIVKEGANKELPEVVRQLGGTNVVLVSDEITYKIAGENCANILKDSGLETSVIVLKHLGFDEATLGEMLINTPNACDIMVGVGTGLINDIVKYFSYKTGRPYIIVATAGSMDGYVSNISAFHENGFKVTYNAHTPSALIGDVDVLKNAPARMIAAGLGDLLGKYTCLCDWRIAKIVIDEHYCDNVVNLMAHSLEKTMAVADKAKDRDPEVIGNIMEGLVLAGVSMGLYANSRPASGCEHHMSHFWELILGQRGIRPAPHGIQVGVATVLMLKAAELIRNTKPDFAAAKAAAATYDPAAWENTMREIYGEAADGVIEMEKKAHKNDTEGRLVRLDTIEKNWDAICQQLQNLPSAEYVKELLEGLGVPADPNLIDVDHDTLKNTMMYCKEVRPRYTMFQLMWDLDILDKISDDVMAAFGL